MNDDVKAPEPINLPQLPPFGPDNWAQRETRQLALHKAVEVSGPGSVESVLDTAQKFYDWLVGNDVVPSNEEGTNA